jgi:hypothetical protein
MSQERNTGRHPAGVGAGGRRLPAPRSARGPVATLALVALVASAPAGARPRKEAPPRLADTGAAETASAAPTGR